MPEERHVRARELLESSGTVLFYKERQLMKENRFPEAVAVIRKRLRWSRLFVVISVLIVAAMFGASIVFESDPSWLDYVTIACLVAMVVITGYSNRRTDSTLAEVDALVGATGSDGSNAVS